jgi:hypothetical protein
LYSKKEFLRELHNEGLTIERVEEVRFHSKRYPDNYFVTVRKIII